MLRNREEIRQFAVCSGWLAVCVALMLAVYALIGKFYVNVLLGGLFGFFMAAGNFLALTVVVSNAADHAEKTGNALEAQRSIQAAAPIRLIALLVIYVLVLKFTELDAIAALLPLILMQVVIRLVGFFGKEGDGK